MRVAIFASGNGSNFAHLVEHFRGQAKVDIVLLICDRAGAYVLERAEALQIPSICIRPKEFANKSEYELAIIQQLEAYEVDWIVLAGYMRLVGPTLLHRYSHRIINLHPALLPAFPGKDAIEQAYSYGVKVTGVTVHFVDEGMDTGPIILQEAVPIVEGESLEALSEKIHEVEHRLLPKAVELLATSEVQCQGRRVHLNSSKTIEGEKSSR